MAEEIDDDSLAPDGNWDGYSDVRQLCGVAVSICRLDHLLTRGALVQDLLNAAEVTKKDPAYKWAYSKITELLNQKAGQRDFEMFKLAANATFDSQGSKTGYLLSDSIVVLWDPEHAWPDHVCRDHFKCIKCGSRTKRSGRTKMRRVCGLKGHFYFSGVKYSCPCCKKPALGKASTSFDSKHPEIMARLPEYVQNQIPVILTAKGAIDRQMFELINYDVLHGASFQSASERISAQLHRDHCQQHHNYLSFHKTKQAIAKQPGQQQRIDQQRGPPEQYDLLDTGGPGKPYIPSGQYFSGAWQEAVKPVVKWAKNHMALITSKFLCLDHTFRTAKYVRHSDGTQSYKCVLTVYTEMGQVMGQYFTHTTSLLEVEDALKKLAARYKEGEGPEVTVHAFHVRRWSCCMHPLHADAQAMYVW